MKKQIQTKKYESKILSAFHQIFQKNKDHLHSIPKQVISPIDREEFLFRQYPLEKKGKTFTFKESRTFRIDDGIIKQVNKNGKQKVLPYPIKVKQQQSVNPQNNQTWSHKDHYYRLILEFTERSPVQIYFKKLQACNEIRIFLLSKCFPEHQRTFLKAFKTHFIPKVHQIFVSSFSYQQMQDKTPKNIIQKNRTLVVSRSVQNFSDNKYLANIISSWHKKSLMTINPKGINQVTQLQLYFEKISFQKLLKITQGTLKIWIGNKTHNAQIKLESSAIKEDIFNVSDIPIGQKVNALEECSKLDLDTIISFQLDSSISQVGQIIKKNWKSERFYLSQLLKNFRYGKNKGICLYNSSDNIQLFFKITKLKCFSYENGQNLSEITPIQYPILRQLIPKNILSKNLKTLQPEQIHVSYEEALKEFVEEQAVQSLGFSKCRKLMDLLDVGGIVDKFFLNFPFNQYINVSHRCTFVYEYLVKKSQKFSFFDADKFVWKYQDHQMRRFLSVLKSFDEIPRINFTQPFYWLCKRCLQLAEHQSLTKWDHDLFDTSLIGRQSLAFFLILAILKLSSPLLLYQPQKVFLVNNSLLFHYVLKVKLPKIYSKFLNIQLNPESLFGIESSSLYCGLIKGEPLIWCLCNFINERKKQQQNLEDKGKQKHLLSLVCFFLSIVTVMDKKHTYSAYISAHHYLACLKIFCKYEIQKYFQALQSQYHQYYKICEQVMRTKQYEELQKSLSNFHGSVNISSSDLNMSQIMSQIFEQFSCYHAKHQADIRKIFIVVDHLKLGLINMGESSKNPSLIICLFQKGAKIYEHELVLQKPITREGHKNIINLQNINHPIELRLISLEQISIFFTVKFSTNSQYSYVSTLDPCSIPSNFYIQNCLILESCFKSLYFDCYTFIQIYLKDSCDADYIDNSVPENYIGKLLLKDRLVNQEQLSILIEQQGENPVKMKQMEEYKQDLIFTSHFFRSFRIPECNFNLLYGKLGWYGCHYLIPDDRILEIYQMTKIEQAEPSVKVLSERTRQRINQVLFYSRCVYGRGIIPCLSQLGPVGSQLTVKSSRDNIVCEEKKQLQHHLNQLPYNSCANLVCHLLTNTIMKDNFAQFYCKTVEELPLLQYLCFKPLEFCILQQLTVSLKISIANTPHTKPTNNIKQKIMTSMTKNIQVIFTNSPISKSTETYYPHPFITDFDYLKQFNSAQMYNRLGAQLGQIAETLVFTYCNDDMHFDSFMELLKLNIFKYCSKPVQNMKKATNYWGKIKCSDRNYLPNIKLYQFHKLVLQAHCDIQLQLILMPVDNINTLISEIVLNKKFRDYGFIAGKWKNVQILALLQGPTHTVYFVECMYTRAKVYLQRQLVILTNSHDRQSMKKLKFTDQEILTVKECVYKQLTHL